LQAIGDSAPFRIRRDRFDNDQFCAGLVAPVQLGIKRTRVCFRVVRDDAHVREVTAQRNARVSDDEDVSRQRFGNLKFEISNHLHRARKAPASLARGRVVLFQQAGAAQLRFVAGADP
jgi:hypothetical protein